MGLAFPQVLVGESVVSRRGRSRGGQRPRDSSVPAAGPSSGGKVERNCSTHTKSHQGPARESGERLHFRIPQHGSGGAGNPARRAACATAVALPHAILNTDISGDKAPGPSLIIDLSCDLLLQLSGRRRQWGRPAGTPYTPPHTSRATGIEYRQPQAGWSDTRCFNADVRLRRRRSTGTIAPGARSLRPWGVGLFPQALEGNPAIYVWQDDIFA